MRWREMGRLGGLWLLLLGGLEAKALEPRMAGWLETLSFPDTGLVVTAKLDTGAKTSAIDAEEVAFFEREGEQWARFYVRAGKNSDDRRLFEARVVGEKTVRAALGRETRPAVDLWVCLGGEKRRVLFTLGDRERMNYRVILGRRALEGRLVVDSGRKRLLTAGCPDSVPEAGREPPGPQAIEAN